MLIKHRGDTHYILKQYWNLIIVEITLNSRSHGAYFGATTLGKIKSKSTSKCKAVDVYRKEESVGYPSSFIMYVACMSSMWHSGHPGGRNENCDTLLIAGRSADSGRDRWQIIIHYNMQNLLNKLERLNPSRFCNCNRQKICIRCPCFKLNYITYNTK